MDALRETSEEFEGRNLAVHGQEPARPLGDRVVGPDIVPPDTMGQVGHLVIAVVDRKDGCSVVEARMQGVIG